MLDNVQSPVAKSQMQRDIVHYPESDLWNTYISELTGIGSTEILLHTSHNTPNPLDITWVLLQSKCGRVRRW